MIKLKDIHNVNDARNYAIDWQNWASNQSLSYGELFGFQNIFRKLGKRFGLTHEFKENGII